MPNVAAPRPGNSQSVVRWLSHLCGSALEHFRHPAGSAMANPVRPEELKDQASDAAAKLGHVMTEWMPLSDTSEYCACRVCGSHLVVQKPTPQCLPRVTGDAMTDTCRDEFIDN